MRPTLLALALLSILHTAHAAAPPGKLRDLTPEETKELAALSTRRDRHFASLEFEQSAKLAEQIADYRRTHQGARHWQAIDARVEIDAWKQQARLPTKHRAAILRAGQFDYQGNDYIARRNYPEAEKAFRQSLQIREKTLGKEHPDFALSLLDLGRSLQGQGRTVEELALFRQALLLLEKALGDDDHRTQFALAALEVALRSRGQYAEALALGRRSLAILEKTYGKQHPRTARGYDALGDALRRQSKAVEAEALFRTAMQIRVDIFGKEHFACAESYEKLADCLWKQNRAGESIPLLRLALQIAEKKLGADHPRVALLCNDLAFCVREEGKVEEGIALLRRSLSIKEKAFGPDHPALSPAYHNLGVHLGMAGKRAEALPLLQKGLRISEKSVGRYHPNTVVSYNSVGLNLWLVLRHNEAMLQWQQSVRGHEAIRAMRADSGFDRALGDSDRRVLTPHAALAVALAGFGQPRNAFRHAESFFARALLDDTASLTADERSLARQLGADMRKLEAAIASFAVIAEPTEEQKERLERTKRQYDNICHDLADLYVAASERAIFPLERIQKAIPEDSALVVWVEELFQSWACIVRPQGPPKWQLLEGGHLILSNQVYATLTDPSSDAKTRQKLLTEFRKGRFDRLRPHLKGVKRLFVVPTNEQARVPADLLADDFIIRYVPSGSVFARMMENHRPFDASSLLAVGDPIFDLAPPPEPPAHGIFVEAVLPESNAARAGLRPGDVLLSIGKQKLESHDDLAAANRLLPANAEVWREGKTFTVRLQGTAVDAVLSKRAVRTAILAWRGSNPSARRGTGHKRLPGTRLEVEAIAPMVKKSQRLLGSEASEQKFDALLSSGELKGYRILHIATHGEANEQAPGRSALILAQDRLPDAEEQAKARKHAYDGRLTVSRIRTEWKGKIDADLVVLSACETGLGKEARGDGLLGFAQAFLSIGARSVVLSRWKVDDTATSLLMVRFYENLLGKRKGVKPMGRAASLDEAKQWLRTLPRKDAERLATLHRGGVLRGSEGLEKPAGKAKPVEYKGDTPFAHPYYWAAFTLIGDPD